MANAFFQPVSAMELARFAGVPTFMRLPALTADDDRMDLVENEYLNGEVIRFDGALRLPPR